MMAARKMQTDASGLNSSPCFPTSYRRTDVKCSSSFPLRELCSLRSPIRTEKSRSPAPEEPWFIMRHGFVGIMVFRTVDARLCNSLKDA